MCFIYGSLISLTSAVREEDKLFLLISHVACKASGHFWSNLLLRAGPVTAGCLELCTLYS